MLKSRDIFKIKGCEDVVASKGNLFTEPQLYFLSAIIMAKIYEFEAHGRMNSLLEENLEVRSE